MKYEINNYKTKTQNKLFNLYKSALLSYYEIIREQISDESI